MSNNFYLDPHRDMWEMLLQEAKDHRVWSFDDLELRAITNTNQKKVVRQESE